MSEYVPTANDVKHWLCEPHYAGGLFDDETAEKFDRMIAEVERAAAEKAWDEGANAVTCEWRLHPERGDAIVKHAQVRTRRPANPYRKEQGNE